MKRDLEKIYMQQKKQWCPM